MLIWLKAWRLKRALRSKKLPTIERAIQSLVATKHSSVPELLRPLLGRNSPGGVHRVAVAGLVSTKHASVPDMLRPYLAPPNTADTAKGLLECAWDPPTGQLRLELLVYSGQFDLAIDEYGELAIEPLIAAFEEKPNHRQSAVAALARLGEPALQKLRSRILSRPFASEAWGTLTLTQPREDDIRSLVTAIGALDWSIAQSAVTGENAHSGANKQYWAVKWLRPIADRAIPSLVPLLRSSSECVRDLTAHVLKTFGWTPGCVQEQLALNFTEGEWNSEIWQDPAALQFLIESRVLNGPQIYRLEEKLATIEPDWRRSPAARAAVPFLATILRGTGESCRQAAEVLAEIGDENALSALWESLGGIRDSRWCVAASALSRAGDRRLVQPLISALDDDNEIVSSTAARSLGSLRDPRAIGPLAQRLEGARLLPDAIIDALGCFNSQEAAGALVGALKRWPDSGQSSRPLVLNALKGCRQSPDLEARRIAEDGVADYAARVLPSLTKKLQSPELKGSMGERERILSDWYFESTPVVNVLAAIGMPAASTIELLLNLLNPGPEQGGQVKGNLNLAAARAIVAMGESAQVLPVVAGWAKRLVGAESYCDSVLDILVEIGQPAIPVLEPLLAHDSSQLRTTARKSLEKIRASAN